MTIAKESRDKVKISEGSGMETDQAEWLDTLLNQSAKVLNKNCNTEETDISITGQQVPLLFENKDNQTEIIMTKKRDIDLDSSKQQPEMTG